MHDELRARAASRGGVFTARDAAEVGVTPARRVTLLASGDWVSLRRGVYAERCVVDSCRGEHRAWHALQTAAALAACGVPAHAAGASAACVLGLEMLHRPPSAITLVRPAQAGSSNGTRSPTLRALAAGLPRCDRSSHGGVAVTTVARTIIDLARSSPMQEAVVLADSAMRLYGVSVADLRTVLCRQRDWPGALAAWPILGLADPRSESVLETVGRLTFLEHGLPRPASQVWVGHERPEIRVDFYFPEHRTVGEADGRVKYTNSQVVWEEKKRQDRLHDLGFEVVRFDHNDATRGGRAMADRFLQAFGRGVTGVGRTFEDPDWWTVSRMAAWDDADAELAWWLRGLGW